MQTYGISPRVPGVLKTVSYANNGVQLYPQTKNLESGVQAGFFFLSQFPESPVMTRINDLQEH